MHFLTLTLTVLLGIIIMAAWIVMVVYVFNDASQRNVGSPALWALGVLVTGPLGLIAWFIDRPNVKRVECDFCGRPILATDYNCPFCGREAQAKGS